MTTGFDIAMGAALVGHMAHMGETISYTPSGSDAVSRTAIVHLGESRIEDDDGGEYMLHPAEVTAYNDATTGIAAPAQGDTATFRSESWAYVGHDPSATHHRIFFERKERLHIGARGGPV